ncbi:MAG: Hpt domain-containing protein [Opitutaceae bacterium]|nr:Hpt domain-containing protein [Opitutaceae bacterium]
MPAVQNSLVIDPSAIAELRALNPDDGDEFLRDIIGIYLEDTPARIVELEECLTSGDVTRFTRAAHSIKGSSANLGAVALRAVAEELEHRSRVQGLGEVAGLIAQIKAEFARAQADLNVLVGR